MYTVPRRAVCLSCTGELRAHFSVWSSCRDSSCHPLPSGNTLVLTVQAFKSFFRKIYSINLVSITIGATMKETPLTQSRNSGRAEVPSTKSLPFDKYADAVKQPSLREKMTNSAPEDNPLQKPFNFKIVKCQVISDPYSFKST